VAYRIVSSLSGLNSTIFGLLLVSLIPSCGNGNRTFLCNSAQGNQTIAECTATQVCIRPSCCPKCIPLGQSGCPPMSSYETSCPPATPCQQVCTPANAYCSDARVGCIAGDSCSCATDRTACAVAGGSCDTSEGVAIWICAECP
jgi:hypothetical protein